MSTSTRIRADGESLRDRKTRLTREAIHRAAVGLSYSRGLDAATIAQIADAAGISQRTFFNYFASKEDAVIGAPASGPDEQLVRDAVAAADFSAGVLEVTAGVVREILSHPLGDDETERMRRILFARDPSLVQRNADAGSALATLLIDALVPVLEADLEKVALPEGTTVREAVRMIVLIAFAPLRHSFARPHPPPEHGDDAAHVPAAHDRFDHSLALFRTVLEGLRT